MRTPWIVTVLTLNDASWVDTLLSLVDGRAGFARSSLTALLLMLLMLTAPAFSKSTLTAGGHCVCFLRLSFNLHDVGNAALLERLASARHAVCTACRWQNRTDRSDSGGPCRRQRPSWISRFTAIEIRYTIISLDLSRPAYQHNVYGSMPVSKYI